MKFSATQLALPMITVASLLVACGGDPQPSATPTSEPAATADIEAPPATTETATPQPSATPTASAAPEAPLAEATCKKSSDCKGGKVCCGSGDGMLGTQCVAECDFMSQSLACSNDAECKKMPTTLFGGTKIKVEGCKQAEKNAALKFCKFEAAK